MKKIQRTRITTSNVMALVHNLLIWVCLLYINAGPLPYYFGFESLTVHVSISVLSCTCIFVLTFAIWFLK